MNKNLFLILASIFAGTVCLPQIAHAQEIKFLMKYGAVAVPTSVQGYENYMELLSYELKGARAVEMTTGEMDNRSRNLPQYDAISFTVEVTGPLLGGLNAEALKGNGTPVFIVGVVVERGIPTEFLKISLTDCILNYLSTSGTEGSMGLMEGGITFTSIEIETTDPDPRGTGTLRTGFDLTTGLPD